MIRVTSKNEIRNPLSEKQVVEVIESDERRNFLKPEQEVRNYFLVLNFLEAMVNKREPFLKQLILDVHRLRRIPYLKAELFKKFGFQKFMSDV